MKNGVFIDGNGNVNVWNFLFDRKLDLAIELPADEFSICNTREADRDSRRKPELDAFITSTIARCNIQTDSCLGFADDSKPADEQRFGRFASDEEIAFIASQQASGRVHQGENAAPTKVESG